MLLLENGVEDLQSRKISHQEKTKALINLEHVSRGKLRKIRDRLAVAKPRGVGLSRRLTNEWKSYRSQIERLEKEVFQPTEEKIECRISLAAEQSHLQLDHMVRLKSAVAKYKDDALNTARQLRHSTTSLSNEIAEHIKGEVSDSFERIKRVTDSAMNELASMENFPRGTEEFTNAREKYALLINSVREIENLKIERLRDQLSLVADLWKSDSFDSAELTEALEEELEELKAQRDANLELAQIGMALNTISHEFDKCVGSLRNGVRKLKAWADANQELRTLYTDIRISFEHLDEYLTMFTPLDRRLHRKKMQISGKHIFEFVTRLFEVRTSRHNVKLGATEEFLASSILGYPSSIYPPFVNLVDNSIFWLQQIRDNQREITFDAEGGDLLVVDNGPGIGIRDRENIFAMNFSRKPGGRGMGLHISRETLLRTGFSLTLDIDERSVATTFRISKIDSNINTGEIE